MEIWKDIPDYIGKYQVSNRGRVRSVKNKIKILKPKLDYGYERFTLYKNNNKTTVQGHRLVAICFLLKIEGKDFINHKNGVKNDNRVNNLEWCTKKENGTHASKNGFYKKGLKHHKSKLILDLYTGIFYYSIKELSDTLCITYSTLRSRLNSENNKRYAKT